MNGELAQTASLVAHGNAFLARDGRPFPNPIDSNSTFQYVNSVKFVRSNRHSSNGPESHLLADSARTWFQKLLANGARHLWLIVSSARHALLDTTLYRSGSNPWEIQADYSAGFEIWTPRWTSATGTQTGKSASDKRIWDIVYVARKQPISLAPTVDLDNARLRLSEALEDAMELADKARLLQWSRTFYDAEMAVNAPEVQILYHPDLLPDNGYGIRARRLMAAASKAWVFGGIGSWNDVIISNASLKRKYAETTKNLYEAVLFAIANAVNSFDPSSRLDASMP